MKVQSMAPMQVHESREDAEIGFERVKEFPRVHASAKPNAEQGEEGELKKGIKRLTDFMSQASRKKRRRKNTNSKLKAIDAYQAASEDEVEEELKGSTYDRSA